MNSGSSNADLLNGRIIKLGIQCTDNAKNPLSTLMLLFKYEGKVNCKLRFSFIYVKYHIQCSAQESTISYLVTLFLSFLLSFSRLQ